MLAGFVFGSNVCFAKHHQVVDVLGIDAEHILVGVKVKQILTTIAFLKLPDHAPDQPFPVSAAAGQSQPAEFFCPEPSLIFSRREIA